MISYCFGLGGFLRVVPLVDGGGHAVHVIHESGLREVDGAPWQKVLVKDGAGVWHVLDYKMTRETGAWKIDGVQFLRRAEVGV